MRLGIGELEKIIDSAISRKDRDPLEFYRLIVKELDRRKALKERISAEEK